MANDDTAPWRPADAGDYAVSAFADYALRDSSTAGCCDRSMLT
jgi:hypothetical protein